jgi:hypothetical protein
MPPSISTSRSSRRLAWRLKIEFISEKTEHALQTPGAGFVQDGPAPKIEHSLLKHLWLLSAILAPKSGAGYLLGVSLVVFGLDHFLSLEPIGTLVANWIPWHVFWIAFFGAGLVAAGLAISLNVLARWGAASVGFMFAIWIV